MRQAIKIRVVATDMATAGCHIRIRRKLLVDKVINEREIPNCKFSQRDIVNVSTVRMLGVVTPDIYQYALDQNSPVEILYIDS